MRELVHEIDSHMELVDLEVASNLDFAPHMASLPPPDSTALPAEDVLAQPAVDTATPQPDDPPV